MKIAMIALGSRGDVQPYIALGKGLQEAGHSVRLVTHEGYEALVQRHGLLFYPVAGDVQAVLQSPEMRELMKKGNILAINAYTSKHAQAAAISWQRDGLAACQGMDLLVAGLGGLYMGLSLAQKLSLPLLQAHVFPFTPTRAFPAPLFPAWVGKLGGRANRLTHHLMRQIMWQGSRKADSLARREVLGMSPAPLLGPYGAQAIQNTAVLYGFSPAVIPTPDDWDTHTHITGYWFLEASANWSPPAELTAFLQAGSPPVYIGFGSMTLPDAAQTVNLIIEAAQQSGQRVLLASGWQELAGLRLPKTVYPVGSVPHDWLFEQVTAVVHHGGAGTTAAGLRAGVPSFIVPFFGDQPFWGARVAALGVGPAPLAHKKLTSTHLAQALHTMSTDEGMRQRAATLGATIRAEDGVGAAVRQIEAFGVASGLA